MMVTSDFTTNPYWWDAAPPDPEAKDPLPASVDVAIVGSGFCGLSAALELARGGLSVAVLEAGPLGIGASSRSGGMVSSGQKLVLTDVLKDFPEDEANHALEDSAETFDFLKDLITRENLDADLQLTGRFFGAWTPKHFETLKKNAELLARRTGVTTRIVQKSEQRAEIGSDFYHGGMLVEEYGGVHPAKYNRALRQAAKAAGAGLYAFAAVEGWERDGDRLTVKTARGTLKAREVMVATNGYTTGELSWFRRRLIPVTAYIVATEPLSPALMDELIPKKRMVSDTRKELSFLRPSPDGTRMLLGGRPNAFLNDEERAVTGLRARLVQIFPQLKDVRISHAWRGNVCMTFDHLPHLGREEGIHYALGCNGNGVALMTWLGRQTALRILGKQNRISVFQDRPFPTAPYYKERTWFLPFVSAGYHARDFLDRPRAVVAERALRRSS